MIRNIRLYDFRGFEDLEIKLRPKINLLIGDNASGKTGIIKACQYVLGTFFHGLSGSGEEMTKCGGTLLPKHQILEIDILPRGRHYLTIRYRFTLMPRMRDRYLPTKYLGRISLEKSRIEHIKARSIHPGLQLDYTNMVICCEGGTKNGGIRCDNAKGNKEISFDLFGDVLFESISYSTRGEIKSSNPDWSREINDVLNLNVALICSNREQALDRILSNLQRLNLTEKRRKIKSYKYKIEHGDTEGKYPPYGSYILYMLEKLERRLQ